MIGQNEGEHFLVGWWSGQVQVSTIDGVSWEGSDVGGTEGLGLIEKHH